MSKTKIQWADMVWNVTTGCTPVSSGCTKCYARRMSKRLAGRFGYPADDPFKVTLHHDRLDEPLGWKKPRRVFVCSMGDLFHEDVPDEFIDKVFGKIAICEHHTFLILTKRSHRMWRYLKRWGNLAVDFPNVQWGTSVENEEQFCLRVPWLAGLKRLNLDIKIFLSIEPALGLIDANVYLHLIDGVILGGESGPGARPMHPDWARKVRDDCKAAGVPFFFKQWGAWVHCLAPKWGRCFDPDDDNSSTNLSPPKTKWVTPDGKTHEYVEGDSRGTFMRRVGKKHSGALLDGREHRELP